MRKIRSQKWAAFRLGHLTRILRSVLGSVFEELAPIRDAGACLRQMEEAVFLLIGHLSETELAEYRRLAERTQTLYERALLDKFAPQEAVGKYLEYYHEHLHVLCFRSVEKRADLSGWFGVAEAIADMQCRLIFDREELDPSTICSRFERAFIGLNGRDRELAEGFTNEVRTGATEGLEYRLCDSYGDLSQVLSGRNAEGIECS